MSHKKLIQEAREARENDNLELAINKAGQALTHATSNEERAKAYAEFGFAYYHQGEYKTALGYFLSMKEVAPRGHTRTCALAHIGATYIKLGNKKDAHRFASQAYMEVVFIPVQEKPADFVWIVHQLVKASIFSKQGRRIIYPLIWEEFQALKFAMVKEKDQHAKLVWTTGLIADLVYEVPMRKFMVRVAIYFAKRWGLVLRAKQLESVLAQM